jgi:hypothetical protein
VVYSLSGSLEEGCVTKDLLVFGGHSVPGFHLPVELRVVDSPKDRPVFGKALNQRVQELPLFRRSLRQTGDPQVPSEQLN